MEFFFYLWIGIACFEFLTVGEGMCVCVCMIVMYTNELPMNTLVPGPDITIFIIIILASAIYGELVLFARD